MNLTTHYIEEIHNEGPYSSDWSAKFPSKVFIKVILTVRVNAGITQKQHRIWETEEWKKIKKQGYYVE